MKPLFTQKPGRWERQVRRCWDNPLFTRQVDETALQQAQQKDRQELDDFMNGFRDLVQQAVALGDQAEGEDLLKIKQQLDRTYERSALIAGDTAEIQAMIRRLIDSISATMARGMSTDLEAMDRMSKEQRARELHFEMLKEPLVADIISPDSPIAEDELVPVLLTESEEAVGRALQLFSPEQLMLLVNMAEEVLQQLDDAEPVKSSARQRLEQIRQHLASLE